jgi:phage terminase large subunit-like protein
MPTLPEPTVGPLPGSGVGWQAWLETHFPHVCRFTFGKRHQAFWRWIDQLKLGVRPKAFIAIWPRGGAKSTTVELGVARVCAKLSRRFVLIVSETQEQADKHVQAIAAHLERLGVERAVNQYGTSKGWKRQQLRTANGFNVAAFGLDAGSRGVKLEEFRPDWIVLDDIDGRHDTAKTTEKKRQIITETLLPAGSADCAISFLQNKIAEDSLISQIADGRAEFLLRREPVSEEPAVLGLTYELREDENGTASYVVTGGEPTWDGQSLAICEMQINDWGLQAFLREAQHEVENADGIFFRVEMLKTIKPEDVPPLRTGGISFDLAATEDGGDYTAGVPIAASEKGAKYYIFGLLHGQWSSERVREVIELGCAEFLPRFPASFLRLPQDGGQAGKDQSRQLTKEYAKWRPRIKPETGDKATRATGLQDALNKGNVYLVEQDLPPRFARYAKKKEAALRWQVWHQTLRNEFRKFREDLSHDTDDIVDGSANGFNEVAAKREARMG